MNKYLIITDMICMEIFNLEIIYLNRLFRMFKLYIFYNKLAAG